MLWKFPSHISKQLNLKLWAHPLDFCWDDLMICTWTSGQVHRFYQSRPPVEPEGELEWTAQKAEIFVDSKDALKFLWKVELSWKCMLFLFVSSNLLKKAETQIVFYLYLPEAVVCGWPEKVSCSSYRVPYIYIQSLLRHLLSHSMVH